MMVERRNIEQVLSLFVGQLLTVFRYSLSHFDEPISQVGVQSKCPSDWIERGYKLLAL